ncbi:MAG: Ig-like domain-containing protein [Schleiferiaceae bacterium]|nr:Ig-like domain-containing protein [Schleiferiaceae bacterium]
MKKDFRQLRAALRLAVGLAVGAMLLGPPAGVVSSCATQSAPSGGPRDSLPPELDTAFPANGKVNFQGASIRLRFNEYLKLQGASQQIRISPPLKNGLTVESRGREINLSWEDSLKPKTTYIISFGQSLKDLTEGNVNDSLRYVFSTGPYLDSLALQGRVEDAYSGAPVGDILVGLYRLAAPPDSGPAAPRDSMLYKKLPNYYALSDKEGRFALRYLRPGRYRLVAYQDPDGDFKLRGWPLMAFWADTIALQPGREMPSFTLRASTPRPPQKLYSARAVAVGRWQLAFARPTDSLHIRPVPPVAPDAGFLERPGNKDTLFYWYRGSRDSLGLRLTDSSRAGAPLDTLIYLRPRRGDPPQLKLNITPPQTAAGDTLRLESNLPLLTVDSSRARRLGRDTTTVRWRPQPGHRRRFWLRAHKRDHQLVLDPGAVQAWYGRENDSLGQKIEVLPQEELGSLRLKVIADSCCHYLLQLVDADDELLTTQKFRGQTILRRENLPAGKLKAYLVQDQNQDGYWTPGFYWQNRLPEPRLAYPEALEIRANWEQSFEWKLEAPAEAEE